MGNSMRLLLLYTASFFFFSLQGSFADFRINLPLYHGSEGYLAACLLSRDAHQDIRDWVEYHHWIGVEKIFIYDHSSHPPMYDEISDFIEDGIVQYTYFKSDFPPLRDGNFATGLQGRVFSHCFAQGRTYFKWMMFTDSDEFALVRDPKYNYNLAALLRRHEHAGAVLAHWQYVGSGGLKKRTPNMPAMTTFTKCYPELNTHVKGIAFTRYTAVGSNPHLFAYGGNRGGIRVGDNMVVLGLPRIPNPPPNPPLVLMHYIGSEEEWRATGRNGRRRVSIGVPKNSQWNSIVDRRSDVTCMGGKEAFEKMKRRPFPPRSLAGRWLAEKKKAEEEAARSGGGGGGAGANGTRTL